MSKIIEENLLSYIKDKKIARTKEIEVKFKLTQSSARRYLIKLEEKGFINRAFGEVILKENENFEDEDFYTKLNSNIIEKRKIAEFASKLAKNYKTIFIDSGSLCYYLLDFLDKKIELFTNSLSNAKRAIDLKFENVNILGGTIKNETKSIVDLDENVIDKINFPISFLGVNAIDDNGNLYTPEKRESKTKFNIMSKSLFSVILAEKEKFGKISTFNFLPKKSHFIIVTNNKKILLKNKKIQILST